MPANLNMAASGIAYTSSDTGGWQRPSGPKAPHAPLIDPAGATAMATDYADYPELFVRWFELNSFTPTLRIHGRRPATAIWEYGKAAEPVLASWLRLRHSLIPYIYSLGHATYDNGAPFMRALWMDFPNDPRVKTIGDQYMFGPAFLAAPVTEQGQTSRPVYLPAGTDWYDWWTGAKIAAARRSRPRRRSIACRCSCARARSCRSARRCPAPPPRSGSRASASSRAETRCSRYT
ncbi:MAG: TIM-barrel domain-containing protein, partial [Janthinobacterium lividum]